MKTLLILSTALMILLSGCGFCNLGNFVLPDDPEFLTLIQELDTPRKACQYALDNFALKVHYIYAPDPYKLWQIKEGDCNDFALWGQFLANLHGYETYSIVIEYSDYGSDHCIAIYDFNGCLHFSDNQYYLSTGYSNFRDVVILDTSLYHPDKTWSSYIIYDYDNNIVGQATE